MFTHNESTARYAFVCLVVRSGKARTLTASHYLMASGRLATANAVRLGDRLHLADNTRDAVAAVEHITSTSLYNSQKLNGSLMVEGVVTSCYTTMHLSAANGSLLASLHANYSTGTGVKGALHELSRVICSNRQ